MTAQRSQPVPPVKLMTTRVEPDAVKWTELLMTTGELSRSNRGVSETAALQDLRVFKYKTLVFCCQF